MTSSEQSGTDLDQEIDQAWAAFEPTLSQRIAALEDGHSLLVGLDDEDPTDGASPYLQAMAFADGTARRLEVSSDQVLGPQFRLGPTGAEALSRLGFESPSPDPDDDAPNWFLHANAAEPDRLAALAVSVLREVFGVVHPLLLAGMPAGPDGPDSLVTADPGGTEPRPEPLDLDVAYTVESSDELGALVTRTLATLGLPHVSDDEGDWPYDLGRTTAWVRVLVTEPTVHVFAVVVHSIRSARVASRELGILNRDAAHLRYVVDGDLLVVMADVPADPFVPRHLEGALRRVRRAAGRTASDFALRTGGRV